MKIIIKLMLLLVLYSIYASAQPEDELPIMGRWKIISYRINSSADKTQAQSWVNKLIEFTPSRAALFYGGDTYQLCPQFDYQVTTENAPQFFSSHYQIEPNQLGVIQTTVQVVNIVCQGSNWLADKAGFIKVTDEQMLSQWHGIMFYFAKQNDLLDPSPIIQITSPDTLLVTPQSVGLINSESDFNQSVLTDNFPGYTITSETKTNERGQTLIADFKLSLADQLLLKVYPDPQTNKIKSISLFDPQIQVQVPGNAKLGMTYAELFKNDEVFLDCQAGTTPARINQTICFFKNLPTIQYVFESKTSSNASLLSPIEELNRAQLVELIWIANRQWVPSPAKPKLAEAAHSPNLKTAATAMVGPMDVKSVYEVQNQHLQEVNQQLSEMLQKQFSPPSSQDHSNSVDQPQPLTYFTQSQKIWEQYRDDNCQWYSALEPDETQQDLKKLTCLEQMTRDRVAEIESVLKNYQPDN